MASTRKTRILIVRLSAIGDVLHGLPVANAIADHLPDAEIGWVVEGRTATMLAGHPSLSRVFQVRRGWLRSPRETLKLRRALRDFAPDIAIDLQGLTKSAIAAKLSGASRRIGFDGVDGRELSRWLNNDLVTPTARHVIDRNLELLKPLGVHSPRVRFDLPRRADDESFADRWIGQLKLNGGFAVINPGAGWKSKLWPTHRFAAVARRLGRFHGLQSLVVWAGDEELRWAQSIVRASERSALLAPQTSLTELAALLRRARLFVGSDTGPLHLAVAVGTPSIGLFGPMPAERNGPYGPPHIGLQRMSVEGGSRQRRNAPPAVMEAISVADVFDACEVVLAATPTAGQLRRSEQAA